MCKLNSAKGIIYQIHVGATGKSYIGQSQRSFVQRYSIHPKYAESEKRIIQALCEGKSAKHTVRNPALLKDIANNPSTVSIKILQEGIKDSKKRQKIENKFIKKFDALENGYNQISTTTSRLEAKLFKKYERKEPIEIYDLDEEKVIKTINPAIEILKKYAKYGKIESAKPEDCSVTMYRYISHICRGLFFKKGDKPEALLGACHNSSNTFSYFGLTPHELFKTLDDPDCDLRISDRPYLIKKDEKGRGRQFNESVRLKTLVLRPEFKNIDRSDEILKALEEDLENKKQEYVKKAYKLYDKLFEIGAPQSLVALKKLLPKLKVT